MRSGVADVAVCMLLVLACCKANLIDPASQMKIYSMPQLSGEEFDVHFNEIKSVKLFNSHEDLYNIELSPDNNVCYPLQRMLDFD